MINTCMALAMTWPNPQPMGTQAHEGPPCLVVFMDVAGRVQSTSPSTGIDPRFTLPRGKLELGLAAAPGVWARMQVDARPTGVGTNLGVQGQTQVMGVTVAEAGWSVPSVGLTLTAGLVDDAWVAVANPAMSFRPLHATQAERMGWVVRADFGGRLIWSAPERWIEAEVALTSGEGLQSPDRNNGKDSTLRLSVRPLARVDLDPELLVVTLFARDGSRGAAVTRAHRLGAMVAGRHEMLRYGVSAMKSWGLDTDPDAVPLGASGWLTVDHGMATGHVEADVTSYRPGQSDALGLDVFAAGGVRAVSVRQRPAYLVAGIEHARLSSGAAVVQGGEGAQRSTTLFLQFGTQLTHAVSLDSSP